MPEFLRTHASERAARAPIVQDPQLDELRLRDQMPSTAQLRQPHMLSTGQVQSLQRQIGNREVSQLLNKAGASTSAAAHQGAVSAPVIQRKPSDTLTEDARRKAQMPKQHTPPVIQRWPFDKDGRDLSRDIDWGRGLDKANTMIGGFSGIKNFLAEKMSGLKLPKGYGRFNKGLDIANTGSKFMSQGITDDSVSSGISTGINLIPQLLMFNLARGGYDMTMEGMGKGHLTSTALLSSGFKHMREGAKNYSPIEMEFDRDNPF